MSYAELHEVRGAMRIDDFADDTVLQASLDAACAQIDAWCSRSFTVASGTATRDFVPDDAFVLYVDDCTTVSSITLDTDGDGTYETTMLTSDYQLEPVNGRAAGVTSPYYRVRAVDNYLWPRIVGRATVRVAATWGWTATPATVKQAAIIQTEYLFKALDAPLGVAGFGDVGALRMNTRMHPAVQMLLEPYRRHDRVIG